MSQTINITADVMVLQDMSQAELEAKYLAHVAALPPDLVPMYSMKKLSQVR